MRKCIEDVTALQLRLKKIIGRKAAAAYVGVIMIGAILCGIAINLVTNALPASAPIAAAGHSLSIVHWTCAAFLAVMMAYNLVRPLGMGHRKPR